MALVVKRDARMGVAEYKRWFEPRLDEERWELLDGEPVLMALQSARHQRIITNLVKRLDTLAEKRGCGAYPGLAILSAAMDDYAPYPDVVVHCGPMPPTAFADDPLMIVEVLSPGTMTNDRGRKLAFYGTVSSLQSLADRIPEPAPDRGVAPGCRMDHAGRWTGRVRRPSGTRR